PRTLEGVSGSRAHAYLATLRRATMVTTAAIESRSSRAGERWKCGVSATTAVPAESRYEHADAQAAPRAPCVGIQSKSSATVAASPTSAATVRNPGRPTATLVAPATCITASAGTPNSSTLAGPVAPANGTP